MANKRIDGGTLEGFNGGSVSLGQGRLVDRGG